MKDKKGEAKHYDKDRGLDESFDEDSNLEVEDED